MIFQSVGHQFAPKVKKFYNKNNQKTSEAELRLDEIEADFSYSLNLPLIQVSLCSTTLYFTNNQKIISCTIKIVLYVVPPFKVGSTWNILQTLPGKIVIILQND